MGDGFTFMNLSTKPFYLRSIGLLIAVWCLHASSAERRPYLAMSSIVLPGSGQFLTGHPVKGVALALAQGIALGMAYTENATYTQWYNEERGRALDSANSLAFGVALLAGDTSLDSAGQVTLRGLQVSLGGARHYASVTEGNYRSSRQLRNMELFWAGGVYAYNIMDALEKGMFRQSDTKKSPATAVLLSSLVPGAGQVYNGSLSKAGMVWMVQGSLGVSALYRHDLMRYYETQIANLSSSGPDSAAYAGRLRALESSRNSARSKRNSFIWYSLGFYFYNVFDALVDAHLHDFEQNMEISLVPQADGMRIAGVFPIRGKKN